MSTNKIVDGTACLILRFRRPGIKRKLEEDQFTAGDAEKALVDGHKVIIDSPEYGHVAALEGAIKSYLRSKALPSRLYRDATYLIPLKSLEGVDEYLETMQAEWREKVDAFMSVYQTRKTETMQRLGNVADEADYKTEADLRSSFKMHSEWVTLSTPTSLKKISAKMFEREERRLSERLQIAEQEIVAAFRLRFLDMVSGMKDMLQGGTTESGKKKKFSGGRIDKLVQYVEKFKGEQNVCGDGELVVAMDHASKLLQGIDPKELKTDEKFRAALGEGFAAIQKTLETLTVVKGRRLIEDE